MAGLSGLSDFSGLSGLSGEAFSNFAKEGGRVGSGCLGSGTGGITRCARLTPTVKRRAR